MRHNGVMPLIDNVLQIRIMLVAIVGVMLLGPMRVDAQELGGNGFEAMLAGFDQRAERAQNLLRSGTDDGPIAVQRNLDEMRRTIARDRDRAARLVASGTFQTRYLNAQIDGLGALPADGASEPSPIADRRQALEERLARAMLPLFEL